LTVLSVFVFLEVSNQALCALTAFLGALVGQAGLGGVPVQRPAVNSSRDDQEAVGLRDATFEKEERVRAHILVCFLAYVRWKTLAQLCQRAGLGQEPRRVFDEISRVKVVDVVFPASQGIDIMKRYVTRPTDHQAVLLQRLGLALPARLEIARM